MSSDGLVIVGASVAGAKAAEAARQEGWSEPIRLIGKESHLPHERPPLSKGALIGRVPPSAAQVHPGSFYATNEIDLLLGTATTSMSLADKTVELDGGRRLRFEQLVLATASSARTLPFPVRTFPAWTRCAPLTTCWHCAMNCSRETDRSRRGMLDRDRGRGGCPTTGL